KSQLRIFRGGYTASSGTKAGRKTLERQQDRAARLEGGGRKMSGQAEKNEKRPVKSAQDEAMPDWSAYRGVMVYVEQREGVAKPVSWQLLGAGRKLADKLDVPLMAVVIGYQVHHLARE